MRSSVGSRNPRPERRLLYGDKTVDSTVKWTEPVMKGAGSQSEITYTYKITNLAPWAERPDIQRKFGDVRTTVNGISKSNEIAELQLTNQGWEVPSQRSDERQIAITANHLSSACYVLKCAPLRAIAMTDLSVALTHLDLAPSPDLFGIHPIHQVRQEAPLQIPTSSRQSALCRSYAEPQAICCFFD